MLSCLLINWNDFFILGAWTTNIKFYWLFFMTCPKYKPVYIKAG